jgi:hypothetical protein
MDDPMIFRRTTFTTLVVMLFGVAGARAQEAPGGDPATAFALFHDGRRLIAEGRVAEACSRFEASMAVVPRLGVQLNLADCYQQLGRLASAWVAFGEAASLARRWKDPRQDYARQRQSALVPGLSRLSITLDPRASIRDLVVTRDGVTVLPAAHGVEVPVDLGEHIVEASAPGRTPWSARVVVSDHGAVVTVVVPDLARDDGVAAAPATSSAAPATSSAAPATPSVPLGPRRRTLATWVVGGAGVAGLGVGTYFGILARSRWQRARTGCDPSSVCSDSVLADVQRSRRDGDISTAAFAIGGAALVTSVLLHLRSPREPAGRVVGAAISHGGVALTIAGGF